MKEKILEELYSRQRFGIKPGLERTYYLLDKAENPQNSLRTIHVAGTNGKGTVCGVISSILMEAGYKVAHYTSPHIKDFNERTRINGTKISDKDLIMLAEEFLNIAHDTEITFFEITTAMAFKYFADNKPDFCVIETGMGGRYDSTNVINPILTIITEIGVEHTEYLGDTIEKIAFEKAGIIKKNVPLICAATKKEAIDIIVKISKEKDSHIFVPKDIFNVGKPVYFPDFTMSFEIESRVRYFEIKSPFAGEHQIENLLTAISAVEQLGIKEEELIKNGILNAIVNTGTIARIQQIRKEPPLVIDSAHNPDSFKKLRDTVEKCSGKGEKWTVLFAAMSDKNIEKMLEAIKPITEELVITKPEITRAMEIQEITKLATLLGFKRMKITSSALEGIDYVLQKGKPAIVCGSFYLLGDIVDLL